MHATSSIRQKRRPASSSHQNTPHVALSWISPMGCGDVGAYLGRLAAALTKSLLTAAIQRHRARRPDVRRVTIGEGPRATVNRGDMHPEVFGVVTSGEVFESSPADVSVVAPFVSIVDVIPPLDLQFRSSPVFMYRWAVFVSLNKWCVCMSVLWGRARLDAGFRRGLPCDRLGHSPNPRRGRNSGAADLSGQ